MVLTDVNVRLFFWFLGLLFDTLGILLALTFGQRFLLVVILKYFHLAVKSFATVSHFTESPTFVYNWFTEQVFISGFISVDHIIAHTDLVLTLFLFRIILVVTYAIFGVFLYLGATFSVYLLLRFIWHPCISLVIS